MSEGGAKTLLLVEDEAVIALGEKLSLEEIGYRVILAAKGEQAIELASGPASPDLVLMDIDLGGGIDGVEAAGQILRRRELPVLFLSSHSERGIVEKTEGVSSYGYVVKNAGITVLDASIKMAFKLFDANKRLQDNERRQETMISNISDVVAVLGLDGLVKYVSPSIQRRFGWEARSIMGRSVWETVHPLDLELVRAAFGSLLGAGAPPATVEYRYLCADGSYKIISATGINLSDDPLVDGVLVNFRDVTERKEMEESLAHEHYLLQTLMDTTPDHIFFKDLQSRFIKISASQFQKFGLKDESEILGKTDFDFFAEEHARQAFEDEQAIIRTGQMLMKEERETWSGRPDTWVYSIKLPLRDREGAIAGTFGISRDITQMKRTEDELRENNALMGALTLAAQDAIVMMSPRGEISFWNPAAEKIFGYSKAEALGKNLHRLLAPSRYAERYEAALPPFLSRGEGEYPGKISEMGALTKEGLERSVETSLSSVRLKDGWGAVGIVRDVTERRLVEERVERLLAEKELLLREVHHRIKNNMSTIGALLDLQGSTLVEAEGRKALEDAGGRVRSMMVLYEKLYQSTDFSSLSVRDYLPELVDQVLGSFPAVGELRVDKDIGDFALDAQRLQPLGIIVNELLTNAMKYAFVGREGGRISVSASLRGTRVSVAVQDDGVGIPPSVDFGSSSGFGLMLVSVLAAQLKGELAIERGGGTRIVLEFEA